MQELEEKVEEQPVRILTKSPELPGIYEDHSMRLPSLQALAVSSGAIFKREARRMISQLYKKNRDRVRTFTTFAISIIWKNMYHVICIITWSFQKVVEAFQNHFDFKDEQLKVKYWAKYPYSTWDVLNRTNFSYQPIDGSPRALKMQKLCDEDDNPLPRRSSHKYTGLQQEDDDDDDNDGNHDPQCTQMTSLRSPGPDVPQMKQSSSKESVQSEADVLAQSMNEV